MTCLCELSESEKAFLERGESDEEKQYPFVLRHDLQVSLGDEVRQEVKSLYEKHFENPSLQIFEMAGMGTKKVIDGTYRSDVKCWLTPAFCKQHQLTASMTLVKELVNLCGKQLKSSLQLNGDYSVQLACFVSSEKSRL